MCIEKKKKIDSILKKYDFTFENCSISYSLGVFRGGGALVA